MVFAKQTLCCLSYASFQQKSADCNFWSRNFLTSGTLHWPSRTYRGENQQCVLNQRFHGFGFYQLAWKLNLTYNYCGGHLINSVGAFLLNHRGREENNGEINSGMHRILNVSRQPHLFPRSLSNYEHLSSGAFAPSALFLEMASVRILAQYHPLPNGSNLGLRRKI